MKRTTVTLPQELVMALIEFPAKNKTQAVISAIQECIKRKKLETIKSLAANGRWHKNGKGLKMKQRPKSTTLSSVLIDTPIWQDYFQKEEWTFQEVNALMDTGRVCCLDLIVAELFYAGEPEKEMKVLQDFTRIFPVLRESPGLVEAARLAFKLRQRGKKLPLRDCYVAFMAQSHGFFLYTTNQSLRQARRAMEIGLEFFAERRISE